MQVQSCSCLEGTSGAGNGGIGMEEEEEKVEWEHQA